MFDRAGIGRQVARGAMSILHGRSQIIGRFLIPGSGREEAGNRALDLLGCIFRVGYGLLNLLP